MSEIKDGGPAFPCDEQIRDSMIYQPEPGMSVRDFFAATIDVPWNATLETLKLLGEPTPTVGRLAEYRAALRYAEADAMLKERSK